MARQQRRELLRAYIRRGLLWAFALCLLFGVERHSQLPGEAKEALSPVTFLDSSQQHVVKRVTSSFPGARKGADIMVRALRALKPYDVHRKNTVYGQSLCSDEINSDPGHLSTLLSGYFGKAFVLGGIGGAPYVGKTGFAAFSHHVPDSGHVFIIFGPHIGFSPNGEPGKFLRNGQTTLSTSCGAVIAAYNQCKSGENMPADPKDMMQSWLRAKLKMHCDDVTKSVRPMVDLVMKAYKAVEDEMLSIVNTKFGTGHLILLGGIQINMPYPLPGYFMPRHFSVRSAGEEAVSLMSVFK